MAYVPKATPGENFTNLDMITALLARRAPTKPASTGVQVVAADTTGWPCMFAHMMIMDFSCV